ncbi:evolutionarily conserved signaling intermediate in Toll pathway, mitochondrial isoform X1 [Hylaeus volcanicus]|uniref:evolutionarily conserved signaling intermediate in Toll pathway, mitochondrial isoform X1 n=1 Tax=Hylaeus volcanicus TaxID=313075 RepID=UPI0023B858E4|nr:evolutionarily conserved signaling intermediate in Toll pathway, mitochondrial isoform X1 [Hylaeus volcanicus]
MYFLMKRTFNLLDKVPITKGWTFAQLMIFNHFHKNHQILYDEKKHKDAIAVYNFDMMEKKEKETFLDVIRLYVKDRSLQRGQADFIKYALRYMKEFGVHKDLEVYKALLDVFPKGVHIPTNIYQIMVYHYPKQQDVALLLLRQMEENNVMPDYELQEMILNIFGERSYPIQKLYRMAYWMPKFSRLNPWPLPEPTPKDPQVLAKYAIAKISSIDVRARITVYKTKDVLDAVDDTWIISSISKWQQTLLAVQPTNKPLVIEGPFMIWVGDQRIDYFVLKGDPIKREVIPDTTDDVSNLKIPFWQSLHTKIPVTIHEQDDGVYYAMCATGTSSKDSLLSWIRCLEKTNPTLKSIPVVFKFKSLTNDPSYLEDKKANDKEELEDTKILKE